VATLNSTSGGSSESELNELTVMPTGAPSTRAVTTQTPVGKWPSACRKALVSNAGSILTVMLPVSVGEDRESV
jgi:hypothetical protein